MLHSLIENPLLLLFVVIALGYLVGSIRFRGSKLGVAAVLFVGLAIGGLDKQLEIPAIVLNMGLAIFVYSIGLSNGPGFFAFLKRRGNRQMYFLLTLLLGSALLSLIPYFIWGFDRATIAGIYAGSTTSTAALAGVLDILGQQQNDGGINAAVIGYSLSYPMGVIASMIGIILFQRIWKIDYKKEAQSLRKAYPIDQKIESRSLLVQHEAVCDVPIRDLKRSHQWKIVFGRVKRGEETFLSNWDTTFQSGDIIRVAGTEEELEELTQHIGEVASNGLPLEASEYDHKRVFVSNPKVAGQTIASLNLEAHFSAVISRVRRGDSDLLASGQTVLELGDQIRFIARRKDIEGLKKLFGDSYHALSQINLFSFGLGMALGLLLGMITFELPGDIRFRLGFAGGPLLMALLLGTLRRSGPIVWTLPYSASLTLRQIGLTFLLATIGIRSGHTFFTTVAESGALWVFLGGTIVSLGGALLLFWLGYKVFKIPFSLLSGMMANQPAILDFALNKAGNSLPGVGFSLMFPIALIVKILIAQLLFIFLA